MTDKKMKLPSSSVLSGGKMQGASALIPIDVQMKTRKDRNGPHETDKDDETKSSRSMQKRMDADLSESKETEETQLEPSAGLSGTMTTAALSSLNLLKRSGNSLIDLIEDSNNTEPDDIIESAKALAITVQVQVNVIKVLNDIKRRQ